MSGSPCRTQCEWRKRDRARATRRFSEAIRRTKKPAARGGRCVSVLGCWRSPPATGRRTPKIRRDRGAVAAEFGVERPMGVINRPPALIGIEVFVVGRAPLGLGNIGADSPAINRSLEPVMVMIPAASAEVGDRMVRRQGLARGGRSGLGQR